MNFEQYAEFKTFNLDISAVLDNEINAEMKKSQDLKNPRVLDYGCGDGKYFSYFINKGLEPKNLYGVEVSQIRVDRCKKIGWDNVSYIGDPSNIDLPLNFFDVVLMAEVIEHITPDLSESFVRELVSKIKPTGCLLVTTPNYPIKRVYDLVGALTKGRLKRAFDDPTHFSHYNFVKLKSFLEKFFKNVQVMPLKTGFLHKRFRDNFFAHKILAVCRDKIF